MSASSPTQVALTLADLSRQLDTTQAEVETADEQAVHARHAYKHAFARAYLQAEASNAETRKQMAISNTEALDLAAEVADLQVRNLKGRITVLRERIHVGQSYGAAVRSEWAAS